MQTSTDRLDLVTTGEASTGALSSSARAGNESTVEAKKADADDMKPPLVTILSPVALNRVDERTPLSETLEKAVAGCRHKAIANALDT